MSEKYVIMTEKQSFAIIAPYIKKINLLEFKLTEALSLLAQERDWCNRYKKAMKREEGR